jgi:hypothetical protein
VSFKQFLAAASDWRTLLVLGAGIVAAAVLSNPFPAVVGFGLYLWAAQRLASSPRFQQAADQVRTARGLEQHYREMEARARELDPRLLASLPATLDRPWQARVQDVAGAARSVYQEWRKHPEEQAAKAAFVEDALQLAALYMRMLRAFHAIDSGQALSDLKAVKERLARNKWRLEATQDLEARKTLLQAIEMDERVLQQETDELADRERYMAKLAAIESTMDLLRRQVFDPTPGEEGQRVHELLVEAAAMDQAMEEVQQRTRVKAR